MGNANTLPMGLLMLAAPIACTVFAVLVLVLGRGERPADEGDPGEKPRETADESDR